MEITSDHFLNPELSWLDFNWRVLAEATDTTRNLLLDRLRFLAIASSNLDEFFQKNVGGLKRQVAAGIQAPGFDGLTPAQALEKVRAEADRMLQAITMTLYREILPQLSGIGIEIKRYADLTDKEKTWADAYFRAQIYPLLTPLAADPARPFPFISNKSLSLAVELLDERGRWYFARVKVPPVRKRFVEVAIDERSANNVIIPLEEVISGNIGSLFTGMTVQSVSPFRVLRNAEIDEVDEDAEDLLELIAEELRHRKTAPIVAMLIDPRISEQVRHLFVSELQVDTKDIYPTPGIRATTDLIQIADLPGYDEHRMQRWKPKSHAVIAASMGADEQPDMFDIMRRGDMLVHHPYQSFDSSVTALLRQAAADPRVLAIKQTLYRTTADAEGLAALIEAAEDGKLVAVSVELKARFDEERNILVAHRLEEAGAHVTYGLLGLKTHCKATLIVREEDSGIRRYFHLGTGNYNPTTSKIYEDFSLFSCDPYLGEDLSRLFNYLTGYAPSQTYEKLVVAPRYWRQKFVDLIEFEIATAKAGNRAFIRAKMNGLEDPYIVKRLYEASQAGVQIDLIVRGVCRLVPGKPGLSDNIRVRSVVGRFLEHSRVYHFHHGGADAYYIGSGDLMRRNLDRRVEVIVPIEQAGLRDYLNMYFAALLTDTEQSWVMHSDGAYLAQWRGQDGISSHQVMMEHAEKQRSPLGWHPHRADDTLL